MKSKQDLTRQATIFLKKIYDACSALFKQLLIIFFYFFGAELIQDFFPNIITSNNLVLTNLRNIFAELLLLVIFILLFRNTLVPDFKDFKKNWKTCLKKGVIYWIIGVIVMIVSNIIISNFISEIANQAANLETLKSLPIYSVISMVVFAPITEELMTRIYLKNGFKNAIVYCFISGLIFGLLHMLSITSLIELLYIIPYGALGFVFAMIYYKSNNIWTNIFFHSLHNLIAVLLFFIGV